MRGDEPRPAAGACERDRNEQGIDAELEDELHHVDPGRGQQPARGEVDGHDDPAQEAAHVFGETQHRVEDEAHGDDLAGQDGEGPHPQERRHDAAHVAAVAVLQEVADGVQAVLGRDAADARPDQEGRDQRAQPGGAHPPPRADPVAISQAGRADGGAGADVGGDEGREEEAGSESAAGHEEVALRLRPAADDQAHGHDADAVGDEEREMEVHVGGPASARSLPEARAANNNTRRAGPTERCVACGTMRS